MTADDMQLCFNTVLVLSIAAIWLRVLLPIERSGHQIWDTLTFALCTIMCSCKWKDPTQAAAADPVASSAGSANPILC